MTRLILIMLILTGCSDRHGEPTVIGRIVSIEQQSRCEGNIKIKLIQGMSERDEVKVSKHSEFNVKNYLNKKVKITYQKNREMSFGPTCWTGKILAIEEIE